MTTIQTILIPCDFSEAFEQVLQKTHELFPKAKVHVVHVMNTADFANIYAGEPLSVTEFEAQVEAAAHNQMKKLKTKWEKSFAFETKILRGNFEDQITHYVQTQTIDLLAMPTHARKGLKHAILGSFAEKMVRLSPCPVLTFKAY